MNHHINDTFLLIPKLATNFRKTVKYRQTAKIKMTSAGDMVVGEPRGIQYTYIYIIIILKIQANTLSTLKNKDHLVSKLKKIVLSITRSASTFLGFKYILS